MPLCLEGKDIAFQLARRVGCDQHKPHCERCIKLSITAACIYSNHTSPAELGEASDRLPENQHDESQQSPHIAPATFADATGQMPLPEPSTPVQLSSYEKKKTTPEHHTSPSS